MVGRIGGIFSETASVRAPGRSGGGDGCADSREYREYAVGHVTPNMLNGGYKQFFLDDGLDLP